jgi:hypothetical protein
MTSRRYLLCIRNGGHAASLEIGKVYARITDAAAEDVGLVRVVDESHEDYLFPEGFFVPIAIPRAAAKVIEAARD